MRARGARLRRFRCWCVACALSAAVPEAALAMEYAIITSLESEYTTNARRQRDEESSFIHRPGLSAMATHVGASTQLDLTYDAYRRIYQDDIFDSDTVLEGSARGTWRALPDRLDFFASHVSREGEIRTEGQRVPTNLQITSESSAGATLRADLLSNHYGTLTYTYTHNDADETRTDSSRQSVQAAYVLPLSPISTLQLVGTGTDTDFENPLAPDYQAVTGSLAYDRQAARTTLAASVGYSSFDRELARDTADGYVGHVDLSRAIGGASTLALSYSRDFRDNSLRRWTGPGDFSGEVIVGDTDLNEVYLQQTVTVSFATPVGVNRLTVGATGSRQEYESDIDRDTDRLGLNAGLSRPIRPNLTGNAGVYFRRYEFTDERGDDDEYGASLGADWQPSRRLTFTGSVRYFERQSDEAALEDGVDEWSVLLRLSYLLFGNVSQLN